MKKLLVFMSMSFLNIAVAAADADDISISTETCYKITTDDLVLENAFEELSSLPENKIDRKSQMRPLSDIRFRMTDGRIVISEENRIVFFENDEAYMFFLKATSSKTNRFKNGEKSFLAYNKNLEGWVLNFNGYKITINALTQHVAEVTKKDGEGNSEVTRFFCPGWEDETYLAEINEGLIKTSRSRNRMKTYKEFNDWIVESNEEYLRERQTALQGLKSEIGIFGVGIILPWTMPGIIKLVIKTALERLNPREKTEPIEIPSSVKRLKTNEETTN